MNHFKYLILGGGMTADAAMHGIRAVDRSGTIGLIGAEQHPPYNRPPLSKGVWKGKPLESIWRKGDDVQANRQFGRRAVQLDPRHHQVTDDRGEVSSFDKLLIATGATPRRLPFGGDRVIYYRTLDDYQRLHAMIGKGRSFAVIGGGFIGSEVAAALATNDQKVSLIFPDEAIGGRLFPADLASFLNGYYRDKGVEVLPRSSVVGIEQQAGKSIVTIRASATGKEQNLAVDGVVAGIGVEPNVELARAAGLQVDNGIRVDRGLRTSHPDIHAAGDVASFHNPALDRWLRVEHEDNANTMGETAGRSMAGEAVTYDHLPSFYSDLFDLGYEAVGEVDPRLETVADWKEPHREGVVYYMKDGRVRGVLLWNVWEQVEAARRLIGEPGPFRAADLKGRLPV
jgi:3-phenylpropionate/trans-cinnamate dioxygenase ferredoxin reductase subunit